MKLSRRAFAQILAVLTGGTALPVSLAIKQNTLPAHLQKLPLSHNFHGWCKNQGMEIFKGYGLASLLKPDGTYENVVWVSVAIWHPQEGLQAKQHKEENCRQTLLHYLSLQNGVWTRPDGTTFEFLKAL